MPVAGRDGGFSPPSGRDGRSPPGKAETVGRGGAGSSAVLGRAAAEEKLRLGDGVGAGEFVRDIGVGGLVMFIGGVFPGCTNPVYEAGKEGIGGGAEEDWEGAAAALTALDGGPLGGGSFGVLVSGVAEPAFLLTHFFSSES